MLLLDRFVTMSAAPCGQCSNRPFDPARHRSELHDRVALPADAPIVREAKEVERSRSWSSRRPLLRTPRGTLEGDEPALLRVELEPVFLETHGEHFENPSHLPFVALSGFALGFRQGSGPVKMA